MNLAKVFNYRKKLQERLDLLVSVRDDATVSYLPLMRLQAARAIGEHWLWNAGSTAENYQKAVDEFAAALGAYQGSDLSILGERSWIRLRLGQAWRNMADLKAKNGWTTECDSALAALNLVIADYDKEWAANPAAEGMVDLAGIYWWRKGDFAKAEELARRVIATYPAKQGQYPKAYAYYRMGGIYRDRGWKFKEKHGFDHIAEFQKAISSFSMVKPEYYPDISATKSLFLNAPQKIADCLSGMSEYSRARGILEPLLAKSLDTTRPREMLRRGDPAVHGRREVRRSRHARAPGQRDHGLRSRL